MSRWRKIKTVLSGKKQRCPPPFLSEKAFRMRGLLGNWILVITKGELFNWLPDLGFSSGSVVKEFTCNAGDAGDTGSVPGSGRSLGGEHGNPLQCSCLENPMDRGAWQAMVHGVAKCQTRQRWLSTHAQSICTVVLVSGLQHSGSIFLYTPFKGITK